MSYLVTGATGFIGRHLVERLLADPVTDTDGTIFVIVRKGSLRRFEQLTRRWGSPSRVVPVVGDLTADLMGIDPDWVDAQAGKIDHLVHLAALYDMTASDERNELLNVGGTRAAISLAERLQVGCFHQVSSIAVAGDYAGDFDETMFDVGQGLPSPYHRTKYESERIVREDCAVPWRVYRPAIVVGHSETGEMDKIDGPYYFFPTLKLLRDTLPQWAPLVGVDLGHTNIVPVDYVAAAIAHLVHVDGRDGETFQLVNPDPQPTVEVLNTLAGAAGAPRIALPLDRRLTGPLTGLLPTGWVSTDLVRRAGSALIGSAPVQLVWKQTVGRLGVPYEILGHVSLPTTFASRTTTKALAGSGLSCPPLDTYAATLWNYWEQHLDTTTARDSRTRRVLQDARVVITGGSSGIGKATALKVAQAGGVPILVARGKDKLEETRAQIEAGGGTAYVYPCDLSDLEAIDALAQQITAEHERVDFVINNAGRSIRRSLKLSTDRFHDFERTMQLNYFGAIRLVMGLLPAMTEGGHVVNISSIGVQTHPPRFSAYVASKAALDAWSRVVSSELIGDGVTFTTIRMPLVRTPMIAPTKIYDAFPTITPAQAADLVIAALKNKPHEVNTRLGTLGEVTHALMPRTTFRILHLAYQVFPDSAAARGDDTAEEASKEQVLLAKVLKGVHW
ncbi:MAG: SDR family oxidoreductase [Propionibacteriales bacterium]|nr:SDR family oxidoreductase [Propionibacteriales bacterium]